MNIIVRIYMFFINRSLFSTTALSVMLSGVLYTPAYAIDNPLEENEEAVSVPAQQRAPSSVLQETDKKHDSLTTTDPTLHAASTADSQNSCDGSAPNPCGHDNAAENVISKRALVDEGVKEMYDRARAVSKLMQITGTMADSIDSAVIDSAVEYLEKTANEGNVSAMYYAGKWFKNSRKKSPEDLKKALHYFRMAAEQNHVAAMYHVGWLLQGFDGFPSNPAEAFVWLQRAAEQGNVNAMGAFGKLLYDGFEGSPSNHAEAFVWFQRAAKQGHVGAMCNVGWLLFEGFEGSPSNPPEALKWSIMAAEQGHVQSMVNVGILLSDEFEGIPLNLTKAKKWLKMGAKQDSVSAFTTLGKLYSMEQMRNPKKSLKWYKKAAEQGDVGAMAAFGKLLYEGFEGSPSNHAEAFVWFQRAAEQGHVPSMRSVGKLLSDGFEGSPSNPPEALKWFQRAAEQGDVPSMRNIGLLLIDGFEGSPSNSPEAFKWFQRAAEQDEVTSMYHVGLLLIAGFEGSPPNNAEGLKWLQKAAKNGDPHAAQVLAAIKPTQANRAAKKETQTKRKRSQEPQSQSSSMTPDWIRQEHLALEEPSSPIPLQRYMGLYDHFKTISEPERQSFGEIWPSILSYLLNHNDTTRKKEILTYLVEEWNDFHEQSLNLGRKTSRITYVNQLIAFLWINQTKENAVEVLQTYQRHVGPVKVKEGVNNITPEMANILAESLQLLGYYTESQPYVNVLKRSKLTTMQTKGKKLNKNIENNRKKKPSQSLDSLLSKDSSGAASSSQAGHRQEKDRKKRRKTSEAAAPGDTASSGENLSKPEKVRRKRDRSAADEAAADEATADEATSDIAFSNQLKQPESNTSKKSKGPDSKAADIQPGDSSDLGDSTLSPPEQMGLPVSHVKSSTFETSTASLRQDSLEANSSAGSSTGRYSNESSNGFSDESARSEGSASSAPTEQKREKKKPSQKSKFLQRATSSFFDKERATSQREPSQRLIRTESQKWNLASPSQAGSSRQPMLTRTISSEHLVDAHFRIRFKSKKLKEDMQDLRDKKNKDREAVTFREILAQLRVDPYSGIGRPHSLKGNRNGQWARDIEGIHNPRRLIYIVDNGIVTILGIEDYHKR